MPTNDFLPFATAAGANVTPQATYAAASSTAQGFSAGVAKSADVNKALRQAGFIAAAVAQFTADMQAGNVLDDGVIANFETQLKNAIVAQAATAFTGANQQKTGPYYQKLPGGFILQMGSANTSAAGDVGTLFGTNFPNYCIGVFVQIGSNAPYFANVSSTLISGFYCGAYNAAGARATVGAVYFAIGY